MPKLFKPQPTLGMGSSRASGVTDSSGAAWAGQISNAASSSASVAQDYINKSESSLRKTILDTAITQGTNQFLQAYNNRIQNTADENGMPLYPTLTKDVREMGEKIRDSASKFIIDPEASAAFTRKFDSIISNKELEAGEVARRQHLDFSQTKLMENIQGEIKNFGADGIGKKFQYEENIVSMLDSALSNDIISPSEYIVMKDKYISLLNNEGFKTLTMSNPRGALEFFTNNTAEDLGIKESERLAWIDDAESSVAVQEKEIISRQNEQFNLLSSEVEVGNMLPEDQYTMMFKQGSISQIHANKLIAKARAKKKEIEKEFAGVARVDMRLSQGLSTSDLSNADINKHYQSQKNNQGVTQLVDSYKIAEQYGREVPLFMREFKGNLNSNNPIENAQALAVYQTMVGKRQAYFLDSLTNDQRRMLVDADLLESYTNMSHEEAMSHVKKTFEPLTNELRAQRAAEWNAWYKRFPSSKRAGKLSSHIEEVMNDIIGNWFNADMSPGTGKVAEQLYKEAFLTTGSHEGAEKWMEDITAAYAGETQFSREAGQMMFFSPEKIAHGMGLIDEDNKSLELDILEASIKALNESGDKFNRFTPSEVYLMEDGDTNVNPGEYTWRMFVDDPETGEPVELDGGYRLNADTISNLKRRTAEANAKLEQDYVNIDKSGIDTSMTGGVVGFLLGKWIKKKLTSTTIEDKIKAIEEQKGSPLSEQDKADIEKINKETARVTSEINNRKGSK